MSHALENWVEEKRSAYVYHIVAATEKIQVRQQLFSQLASEAEKQAQLWAEIALKAGDKVPVAYQPDSRTKIVVWLICKLGAEKIKPILAAMKIRGLSVYRSDKHANSRTTGFHPTPTNVDEVGASHRGGASSGGLRAAVFGVNDGLVSTACLVMGVAGAATSNSVILITGIAGLLAGAFSMAAGEYISMRSQREMFEYQIGLERAELAQYPKEEAAELALIYAARGMSEDEARTLAQKMIADTELGLDTLAREELGINPDELGSPWLAASSSFVAFGVGGLIPLLPYFFHAQYWVLPMSIAFTAVALFGVGALLSLFTGRNALLGGGRMLLIGGAAGILTYGIGYLMGANIA